MEGRDIGRVVAPHADAKLYIEAEQEERVSRRMRERRSVPGEIARALAERDALDAYTNPLEPAPDAIAIDTTGMDADEVFRAALAIVRSRLRERDR